jgi:hypothetical protein
MHLNAVGRAFGFQLGQQFGQAAERASFDGLALGAQGFQFVRSGEDRPAFDPQSVHGRSEVAAQLTVGQGLVDIGLEIE